MSNLDGDLVRSGGVRRCARPDGCSRTLSTDGQRTIELGGESRGRLGIERRHRGDVRLVRLARDLQLVQRPGGLAVADHVLRRERRVPRELQRSLAVASCCGQGRIRRPL